MRLEDELQARLLERERDGLLRTLDVPRGTDFVSNDYLGFARIPEDLFPVMSLPASRLLGGHSLAHAALEDRVARWKGHAAALLFPSGFQANVSVLSALVGPQDRVLSDAANHASLIDGIRLARPAETIVFPHLSFGAVASALATPFAGRSFVVTESLFGMDADQAPLEAYAELCHRHGAELIVDDAHASGLYGPGGAGLAVPEAAATITTFGKSLAAAGAAVSGSSAVVGWLAQVARGFVYSTAISPLLIAQIDARLDRLARDPIAGARPRQLAKALRARLSRAGFDVRGVDAPIVPLVLGDVARTVALASSLRERGFDVRAVRPPTVPDGTARLRISIHADHTSEMIDALATALERA